MLFLKFLISPTTLIILIGGLITSIFAYLASNKEQKPLPKYIALSVLIGGILVIIGGVLSGYSDFKQTNLLNIRTDQIYNLSKDNAELSKQNTKLSKQNKELNEHTINSITGVDSYCYVLMIVDKFSDWAHLSLMHKGDYPVHQITIHFVDQNKLRNNYKERLDKIPYGDKEKYNRARKKIDLINLDNKLQAEATKVFDLPILTPSIGYELGSFKLPSDITEHHYRVRIFCRNGIFDQEIKCRKIEGNWRFSLRVNKGNLVLEESIHPAIPL